MKSKVHFSSFCIIITEAVIAALLAGIYNPQNEMIGFGKTKCCV